MYDVYVGNELAACPSDEAAMWRVVEKLRACPYPYSLNGINIRVDKDGETIFYSKESAATTESPEPAR
jgi:hypothetical protein